MTLNVLISTIDQGIDKINDILLPPRNDVKYLVSHQFTNEIYRAIPNELIRSDVEISQIKGKGLTRSRNNAIKMANEGICLIADDDVRYTNGYFDTILKAYIDPEIEVACFKINTGEGCPPYKNYPNKVIKSKDKFPHWVSSVEITFKLNAIRNNNITFDERFGLGTKLPGGEEDIFIHDCRNAKLNVNYYPYYIVDHPYESSNKGFSKYTKKRIRINAAMDSRIYGIHSIMNSIVRTFNFIPDRKSQQISTLAYFYHQIKSNLYILITKKN